MKKIDLGEGYSCQLLDESSADALPEGFQANDNTPPRNRTQ
jgi:hypothetical protein